MTISLRRQKSSRQHKKPEYLVAASPVAVKKKTKPTKAKATPVKKKAAEPETYEIETVLDVRRKVGKDGKTTNRVEVQIKWKGYDEPTWEPITYLNKAAEKDARNMLDAKEGKSPKKSKKTKKEEEDATTEEEEETPAAVPEVPAPVEETAPAEEAAPAEETADEGKTDG
mgnify:CR=1 FL=1